MRGTASRVRYQTQESAIAGICFLVSEFQVLNMDRAAPWSVEELLTSTSTDIMR